MATTQFNYHVLFDGGSRRNGSAVQEAYGSYIIHTAKGRQRLARCTFGHDTNNCWQLKNVIEDAIKCCWLRNHIANRERRSERPT